MFKLILPMDDDDLNPHPHIVVEEKGKDFFHVYKVVSFKEKFLFPPFKDWMLKLGINCFFKESYINLCDEIFMEKNNYINDNKFYWKCNDKKCNNCDNNQIIIKEWESLLNKISAQKKLIDEKIIRKKTFNIDTIMKYNLKK